MRRRTFVRAATAFTAPVPLRARSQSATSRPMRRVAVLNPGSDPQPDVPAHQRPAAVALWGSVGLVEGRNVVIERRYADGNLDRLPELAAELLKWDPEVLIAIAEAAGPAARSTQVVPIVAMFAPYPVELGLVDSFAKPGRNITGTTLLVDQQNATKRFQILRALAPSARRISVVGMDFRALTVSGEPVDFSSLDQAAQSLGFDMTHHLLARRPQDVEPTLSAAVAARAQVIAVTGAPFAAERQRVAEFVLRQRWPAFTFNSELRDAGLLLYQSASEAEFAAMFARMVRMTERILHGAKPGEMPMEIATRYEISVNLKTARALGLTVPQSVLLQADRLIE
jgi:putative ABC transport system substrate-binding protein